MTALFHTITVTVPDACIGIITRAAADAGGRIDGMQPCIMKDGRKLPALEGVRNASMRGTNMSTDRIAVQIMKELSFGARTKGELAKACRAKPHLVVTRLRTLRKSGATKLVGKKWVKTNG